MRWRGGAPRVSPSSIGTYLVSGAARGLPKAPRSASSCRSTFGRSRPPAMPTADGRHSQASALRTCFPGCCAGSGTMALVLRSSWHPHTTSVAEGMLHSAAKDLCGNGYICSTRRMATSSDLASRASDQVAVHPFRTDDDAGDLLRVDRRRRRSPSRTGRAQFREVGNRWSRPLWRSSDFGVKITRGFRNMRTIWRLSTWKICAGVVGWTTPDVVGPRTVAGSARCAPTNTPGPGPHSRAAAASA